MDLWIPFPGTSLALLARVRNEGVLLARGNGSKNVCARLVPFKHITFLDIVITICDPNDHS